MYQYLFSFRNGENLTINSEIDINFHELKGGYIFFNDLFINMSQLNYIKKTIILEEA